MPAARAVRLYCTGINHKAGIRCHPYRECTVRPKLILLDDSNINRFFYPIFDCQYLEIKMINTKPSTIR